MSTSNDAESHEKSWSSAFLLVFGVGAIVIATLEVFRGSVLAGFLAVGVAHLCFAPNYRAAAYGASTSSGRVGA